MAYVAGDFLVNVEGTQGGSEIWSNTWCFAGATTIDERAEVVIALQSMYGTLAASLSSEWTAVSATGTTLDNGLSAPYSFGPVVGSSGANPLPTQLAIRVSLNDAENKRGGPYLTGWTISTVGADAGLVSAATKTLVAEAVDDLRLLVLAAGASIALHHPTTDSVSIATQARVGERYDIIRKRANDILEQYVAVPL